MPRMLVNTCQASIRPRQTLSSSSSSLAIIMPEISLHFSLKYQNLSYQIRRKENFEFHTISLQLYSYFPVGQAYIYNSCPSYLSLAASGIIINISIFQTGPFLVGPDQFWPGWTDQNWSGWTTFGPWPKFSLQANRKDTVVCICLGTPYQLYACERLLHDSEPDGLTFVAWRL